MALIFLFEKTDDRPGGLFIQVPAEHPLFSATAKGVAAALAGQGLSNQLVVLLATTDNLRDRHFFDALASWEYRKPVEEQSFQPLPILTIGTEDIMNPQEESGHEAWIKSKIRPDGRYRFLDASIWHYYLPVQQLGLRLPAVLDTIVKNASFGLYSTKVGHEFIEFQSRLLANSWLHYTGEHASSVVPFPFHSESQMHVRYEKDIRYYSLYKRPDAANEPAVALAKGLKWRLLLLDDKSVSPHSLTDGHPTFTGKDGTELRRTKAFIIGRLLRTHVNTAVTVPGHPGIEALINEGQPASAGNSDWSVELNCVSTITEAMDAIKAGGGCYDIILLDFLLDETSGRTGVEFFLDLLKDHASVPYGNRLFGRHWIFSISSYQQAFLDAIHAAGKTLIGHIWYFSRGADPLNTPQLFLEQLIQFVGVQLRELGIEEKENRPELRNIAHLWRTSLVELCRHKKFTRAWAHRSLARTLGYWEKIELLRESRNAGSLFAMSFLTSQNQDSFYNKIVMEEYTNGLHGYLTHLLYMLTYSDGYEWEEMKTDLDMVNALVAGNTNEQKEGYILIDKRVKDLKARYDP